jgi:hypothetical protein
MQFTNILEDAHLAGMDSMTSVIASAILSLQQRSYDVLDLRDTAFDRDYLEFVDYAAELKAKLQVDVDLLPPHNIV